MLGFFCTLPFGYHSYTVVRTAASASWELRGPHIHSISVAWFSELASICWREQSHRRDLYTMREGTWKVPCGAEHKGTSWACEKRLPSNLDLGWGRGGGAGVGSAGVGGGRGGGRYELRSGFIGVKVHNFRVFKLLSKWKTEGLGTCTPTVKSYAPGFSSCPSPAAQIPSTGRPLSSFSLFFCFIFRIGSCCTQVDPQLASLCLCFE